MIIQLLFSLIIILLTYIFTKKYYKKIENVYEKAAFVILIIVFFCPVILYYIDRFNIPTFLKYTTNVDNNNWFSFIGNYISTIIGTFISSLVVVFLTLKQIKIQQDDSKENSRISNMPLLKYNISNKKIESQAIYLYNDLKNETDIYHLYMDIENIGLNHARDLSVTVIIGDKKVFNSKLSDGQSFLLMKNHIYLNFIFDFKHDKNEKFNNAKIYFIFNYSDLIENDYEQKIKISAYISNIISSECGGYRLDINNIIVENEKLLNRK